MALSERQARQESLIERSRLHIESGGNDALPNLFDQSEEAI
ncbi:hypothetical protein COLO4_19505 [Corchorus olitorius]|uniref:Uncharacterized protein n=1 Tax=Corchorus olitorius TaxID=93759 RepID=A0A1R3J581_9ROSI|nr:hypothetical protein COLO4_19505 [Corchorus olitorius]